MILFSWLHIIDHLKNCIGYPRSLASIDHLKNCIGYPRLYIVFDVKHQKQYIILDP